MKYFNSFMWVCLHLLQVYMTHIFLVQACSLVTNAILYRGYRERKKYHLYIWTLKVLFSKKLCKSIVVFFALDACSAFSAHNGFPGGVSHFVAFVCPSMCVCVRTCSCPRVCVCACAGVRAYPPVCICTLFGSDRQLTGGEKTVTEETDIDAEDVSQVPAAEESDSNRGVTDLDATANTTGLDHAESKVSSFGCVCCVFVRHGVGLLRIFLT